MSSDRWMRLEQLFAEALTLPTAERVAFLELNCGDDADLLREIGELLRSHDAPGVLDAAHPPPDAVTPLPSLAVGTSLGPWRIQNMIGRGGMGEVYAAARADGAFEQRVALKLLRHEAVGQLERFHAERRILARLEHPTIARLLDGGIAPDGRPYTVMEYVEGQSLTDYFRQRGSPLHERLALFAQVCDAVAFAHRNLVIHRDLKPANILINAQGEVKLLDFGIAKLLDVAVAPSDADITIAPFTPDYAAPEQFSGEPVTTATDIYALGVLLFELLTAERPLQLHGLPSAYALHRMHERDPPQPSKIAADKVASPVSAKSLRGDLDAIVGKCLRKEPPRRYVTVEALQQDLQRYLHDEPVQARSGARMYVARRFVRRHWLPLSAVTAIFTALVAGAAGIAIQAREALRERDLARSAQAREGAVGDFLITMFREAAQGSSNGKDISAREILRQSAEKITNSYVDKPAQRQAILNSLGSLYTALGDYAGAKALYEEYLRRAGTETTLADLARARGAMAMVHNNLGEYAAGQILIREAKHFWLADPKTYAVELLRASFVEARLAFGLGETDAAIASMRDTVQRSTEINGPNDLRTAQYIGSLANWLADRGDAVEAEERYVQAKKIVDLNNSQATTTGLAILNGMASFQQDQGHRKEAEVLYREVISMLLQRYGRSNRVALVQGNLVTVLQASGRYDETLALLADAESMASEFGGALGESLLRLRMHRINTLVSLGRLADATALRSVLAPQFQTLSVNHPLRARMLVIDFRIALLAGHVADAEVQKRAVDAQLAAMGSSAASARKDLEALDLSARSSGGARMHKL